MVTKQLDSTTQALYILMDLAITDWDKEIENMEKRLYPFAVAGLGFRIDMSQEQFSLAENAIPVKLGGGILFRIKNNFYAFANAELSADIGKENKYVEILKEYANKDDDYEYDSI